jgi:hypothetical protein
MSTEGAEFFEASNLVMGEEKKGWSPDSDGELIRAGCEQTANDAFGESIGKTPESAFSV